jgi:hypothetical protein
MEKLDLKDYKLPEIKENLRDLKKNQRLALEIIETFKIEPFKQGRWFKVCKRFPAFTEDKFLYVKRLLNEGSQIKNPGGYLWSLIFKVAEQQ